MALPPPPDLTPTRPSLPAVDASSPFAAALAHSQQRASGGATASTAAATAKPVTTDQKTTKPSAPSASSRGVRWHELDAAFPIELLYPDAKIYVDRFRDGDAYTMAGCKMRLTKPHHFLDTNTLEPRPAEGKRGSVFLSIEAGNGILARCYRIRPLRSFSVISPHSVIVDEVPHTLPFDVSPMPEMAALRQTVATMKRETLDALAKLFELPSAAPTLASYQRDVDKLRTGLRLYQGVLTCPSTLTAEDWTRITTTSEAVAILKMPDGQLRLPSESIAVTEALYWTVLRLRSPPFSAPFRMIQNTLKFLDTRIRALSLDARVQDREEILAQQTWATCLDCLNKLSRERLFVAVDRLVRLEATAAPPSLMSKCRPAPRAPPCSHGGGNDDEDLENDKLLLSDRLSRDLKTIDPPWTADDEEADLHPLFADASNHGDVEWTPTLDQRGQLLEMNYAHLLRVGDKFRPIPRAVRLDLNLRMRWYRRRHRDTWRLRFRCLDADGTGTLLREPEARLKWFKSQLKSHAVRPLPKAKGKGKGKGKKSASLSGKKRKSAADGADDGEGGEQDDEAAAMMEDDGDADADVDIEDLKGDTEDAGAGVDASERWKTTPPHELRPPFLPKRVVVYDGATFATFADVSKMYSAFKHRDAIAETKKSNAGGLLFEPINKQQLNILKRHDTQCFVLDVITKAPIRVPITAKLLGQRERDRLLLKDTPSKYAVRYGADIPEDDPKATFTYWLFARDAPSAAMASADTTATVLVKFPSVAALEDDVVKQHPTSMFARGYHANHVGLVALSRAAAAEEEKAALSSTAPTTKRTATAKPSAVGRKSFQQLYQEHMRTMTDLRPSADKDDDDADMIELGNEDSTDTEEVEEDDDEDGADGAGDSDDDGGTRDMARRRQQKRGDKPKKKKKEKKPKAPLTEFQRRAAPEAMDQAERDALDLRIPLKTLFAESCAALDVSKHDGGATIRRIQQMLDDIVRKEGFRKEPNVYVDMYSEHADPRGRTTEPELAILLQGLNEAVRRCPSIGIDAAYEKAFDRSREEGQQLRRAQLEQREKEALAEQEADAKAASNVQDNPVAKRVQAAAQAWEAAEKLERETKDATNTPSAAKRIKPNPPPPAAAAPAVVAVVPAPAPAPAPPSPPSLLSVPMTDVKSAAAAAATPLPVDSVLPPPHPVLSIAEALPSVRKHILDAEETYILIRRDPSCTWFRLKRDAALISCALEHVTTEGSSPIPAALPTTIVLVDEARDVVYRGAALDMLLTKFFADQPQDKAAWTATPLTLPAVAHDDPYRNASLLWLLKEEEWNIKENIVAIGALAYHNENGLRDTSRGRRDAAANGKALFLETARPDGGALPGPLVPLTPAETLKLFGHNAKPVFEPVMGQQQQQPLAAATTPLLEKEDATREKLFSLIPACTVVAMHRPSDPVSLLAYKRVRDTMMLTYQKKLTDCRNAIRVANEAYLAEEKRIDAAAVGKREGVMAPVYAKCLQKRDKTIDDLENAFRTEMKKQKINDRSLALHVLDTHLRAIGVHKVVIDRFHRLIRDTTAVPIMKLWDIVGQLQRDALALVRELDAHRASMGELELRARRSILNYSLVGQIAQDVPSFASAKTELPPAVSGWDIVRACAHERWIQQREESTTRAALEERAAEVDVRVREFIVQQAVANNFECPICMNPLATCMAYPSCQHFVCQPCYLGLVQSGRTKCPKCNEAATWTGASLGPQRNYIVSNFVRQLYGIEATQDDLVAPRRAALQRRQIIKLPPSTRKLLEAARGVVARFVDGRSASDADASFLQLPPDMDAALVQEALSEWIVRTPDRAFSSRFRVQVGGQRRVLEFRSRHAAAADATASSSSSSKS